ncbi:hypothetical protein PF005_g27386 [Phytophthora fragariae]|uniref:Integrase catalytic domain-containing protein n=2 Tax=Phytophthora fragariae TaxID=53985 RepID=A0A6A3VP46_9STRA|nr:hypothetical protein PF005_g27386 [Phytophthora fragariae]
MSYQRGPERRRNPLEKLSVDLCSVSEEAITGEMMFLLALDEATRYKWCYLLKNKSDAAPRLEKLILRLNTRFKRAGHINTNGYSPEENGLMERANGIILPRLRAVLHATHQTNLLWGEAALHIVDTLNVLPTEALRGKSPHEALYGTEPSLREMRTWGCVVHAHIPAEKTSTRDKLDPRAELALLLGYSSNTKGYKLLNLKTGGVLQRRSGNVFCHERFTVAQAYVRQLLLNAYKHGAYELPADIPIVPIVTSLEERLFPEAGVSRRLPEQPVPALPTGNDPELVAVDEQVGEQVGERAKGQVQTTTAQSPAPVPSREMVETAERPAQASRRSQRAGRDDPDDDYEPPKKMPAAMPPREAGARRARKPPAHLREYVVGSVINSTADIPVPSTYRQAKQSDHWPEWKAAMEEELASLREHGTWKLVARVKAKRQRVITNKWVYTIKRDAQGRIRRFKARLVIHGFRQQEGVDYAETYAPVIRFETIRAAILYALKRGWNIRQYDVMTAFLYGLLEELIFMEIPSGSDEGSPGGDLICQLIKSLYGLKQAPAVWNKTLRTFLVSLGLTRFDSDYGLYAMYEGDEVQMLLTVYVDDLLLMGPPALCDKVAAQLDAKFTMTSMGEVKYLLGIEITIDREHNQVVYSQRTHIDKLLKKFGLANSYGCWTPQATNESRAKEKSSEPGDLPYRELVGGLQYLVSGSRPDIAHAVRHLGKFLSCYTAAHYREGQRVLRYLLQTRDFALRMDVIPGNNVSITVFTDSDYANDPDDSKSVSGYITFLDGNVISYGSRKQGINAQSSTEAEYIAMNEGVKDILWIVGLCAELRWPASTPMLRGDNQAALYLAEKPGKHSNTKHINNKYHLVRHLVEDGKLRTLHVPTNDNTADIMTKPLARDKYSQFRSHLKVLPIAGTTTAAADALHAATTKRNTGKRRTAG